MMPLVFRCTDKAFKRNVLTIVIHTGFVLQIKQGLQFLPDTLQGFPRARNAGIMLHSAATRHCLLKRSVGAVLRWRTRVFFSSGTRTQRSRQPPGARRSSFGAFLAVVSLFPCVSASDDLVRFEYLDSQSVPIPHHSNESKQTPGTALATLVRLLESLESVQIPLIWALLVSLCSFTLFIAEWRKGQESPRPQALRTRTSQSSSRRIVS